MGHAQSRQQQDQARRERARMGRAAASARTLPSSDGQDHVPDAVAAVADDDASSGRKRRRSSTSPAPATGPNTVNEPLRQRRRRSADAPDSSSASSSADVASQPAASAPADEPMHLESQQLRSPLPSTTATEPSEHVSDASAASVTGASVPAALTREPSSTEDASSADAAAEASNATPPPHLDALRQERERARQRILEALGSRAPIPSPASISAPIQPATTTSTTASATTPSPRPHPLASATLAALLGTMAAAHPATGEASSLPAAAAANLAAAANPSQSSNAQPSQPQQPTRPHTIRVPLQPEMISGTSMVVQGALVARTVASRPASSEASTGDDANASTASDAPRVSESASSSRTEAPRDSNNPIGLPPGALDGDGLRGAVTLEEQAVMLSRILGIAAAATAASLLNASESHHVDPSLLQTSLRRPFERLSQASTDRNERWLADWQRSRTLDRPSSLSGGGTASSSSSNASSLGNGLRGRLAALSRRVHSASSTSGLPPPTSGSESVASQPASSSNDPTEAPGAQSSGEHVDAGRDSSQDSRQQEIIAHLLDAAEREASSQRQRTDSVASSAQDSAVPPQSPSRGSLSRLVRSTLGTFMHPSRLLSTRHSRSEGSQTNDSTSDRDGGSSTYSSNATEAPTADFSLGPNDVVGTLRQVRNGVLPDGVPGSFGSFLNHLVRDLMAAVQLMRPSEEAALGQAEAHTTDYFEHATQAQTTSGAEVLDGETSEPATADAAAASIESTQGQQDQQADDDVGAAETQARRDRDFQNGNLSFFRLFRFDPVAPSQLVPCIVVGVRSLNVTERFGEEMMGSRAPGPGRDAGGTRQQTSRPTTLGSTRTTEASPRARAQSEGAPATAPARDDSTDASGEELPASRFMLFVSGGRYPANHPLLTSNPATAGRDLMILMDLLSTMQAMQNKPSTVTQQEIDGAADLSKIRGSEVAALVGEGKITENMAERCLVCLEDWKQDDECRVLACRHAFHTTCVDRWMTTSSNTCPMCRRQGVTKDGRRAGDETADSQRAAQA
ncbi:FOG: Predicted E3 ubiquitin ligase [Moesziomyces antarcticus T-34]|uniref:FOG: Predicted E3 ubiquitin ligase n=1 Tax=Pseudozyma antarctica (strain T-34) TaxID=1151754 RepID=M9MHR1_PSEA3|nr:FOG: Predicted E3 ubiquitin ligase [Moesziomyces antarcticus T-34]